MTAPAPIEFPFPLPRVHTGVHLANGRMGLLVWGRDEIRVTVARNGFWDRQGARAFATPMSYRALRDALLDGREEEVREAFQAEGHDPSQIPGGRLDLHLGSPPKRAWLHLEEGRLEIELASGHRVEIVLSMRDDVARIVGADNAKLRLHPAWRWTEVAMRARRRLRRANDGMTKVRDSCKPSPPIPR